MSGGQPSAWLANPDVRRGLAVFASLALTPLAMRALGHLAPPRQISARESDHLKSRYSKIEGWSEVVAIVSIWISLLAWFRGGGGDSYWLLAFGFGWMCIAPVLFVATATALRRDLFWTEFWRHHEWKHGVNLHVLAATYATGCVVGILATANLLFTR